jgi:23S rRNA (guanosine2251-2'-O)-methyltransferase
MSNKTTELIFGIHAIVELLKAKRRRIVTLYTTKPEPKAFAQIAELLPKHTQIQYVSREVLHKLAQTTDHQGVVAFATPFQFRKKFFDPSKQPFLLLLDSIQDPRNLGAILRSAYCTGVDGVILPTKAASPLTAAALKASAGLAEHMEILLAPSTAAAVQQLKAAGYTLYLAMVEESYDATAVEYAMPACLVIGSEGVGIAKPIRSQGIAIRLPQRTVDISYNASVAAGILLFLIATQTNRI